MCTVFDSILSNINEILSINPSANFFVFGDFNVHHKDWLTYSGETDRPGEMLNDLTQMVNFPTRIPDCDSHIPTLLVLFFSSDTSICSTMAFLPLENCDHVILSVSIDFPSNSRRDALFHRIADNYSCADWDGLCDHLKDVPWEDISVNFVRGFRLELMYISLIESIRSSLTHHYGFQLLALLP